MANYNHGNKLSGQLRKTVLYMTPQAIKKIFLETILSGSR